MSGSISQTLYGEKSSNLNRLPILESKWNDSSSQVIQTTRGLLSNLSLDSARRATLTETPTDIRPDGTLGGFGLFQADILHRAQCSGRDLGKGP